MLRLRLSESHVVLYKLMLFFNPGTGVYSQFVDADGLSSTGKSTIESERRVASFLKRTFDISHIFGPADDLIDQLIIVGL
uniref:Uncharacterized protein n=1 Tax=Parascaris equorum TaxID=6256 RepID=A0A914R310_PAREQ